jgi:aldehyde:ferredoxin oxidoreductase
MAGENRGYAGRFLRVDLATGETSHVEFDEETLRQWAGGVGLGAKLLYEEVPPGVDWDSPDNRLIFSSGPLGGTRMPGSGTFTVVTKGPLTGGATATQANGYLGAYIKFSGFDGVIFQGQAPEWLYLYVHDGVAELRPASGVLGKDVYDTEEQIKSEIGGSPRSLSVFAIGPSGENLVKFAGILGDHGHAAAHNGTGAVMGSKRVKAIVAARGRSSLTVADRSTTSKAAQAIFEAVKNDPGGGRIYEWGTSMIFTGAEAGGWLPIKNLTTSVFPEAPEFMGERFRTRWELKPEPCWACRMHHCHVMRITDGPFAGQSFEEPEYEAWAAFGPLIGNAEVGAAAWLTEVNERLGFDVNEMGFLAALVMEWYEQGVITKEDTGGLELNWGNYRALADLMHKIAHREGIGDVLAEGIKHASQNVAGGEADWGVYIQKGHGPRGHDHRARWTEIVDYATSSAGTIETGPINQP